MFKHNNNANTSKIENMLYMAIKDAVSNNVFIGVRPSTIDENMDDFVVIDCDLPITDYGSHSTASVYVFLYARPIGNGIKNVARLAEMEESLNIVLDTYTSNVYKLVRQSNGAEYDTGINWHNNFVYISITIH